MKICYMIKYLRVIGNSASSTHQDHLSSDGLLFSEEKVFQTAPQNSGHQQNQQEKRQLENEFHRS